MSIEERSPSRSGPSEAGVTWEIGPDGIAVIQFDTPASKVNLIRTETLDALEEAITLLARRGGVRGAVLSRKISGRKTGYPRAHDHLR